MSGLMNINQIYSILLFQSTLVNSRIILFTNTMFTLILFAITLIIFLLLIFFPWRGTKGLQLISKGSRDLNSTTHIKTLKMVVSVFFFLLPFLLFCNSNFKLANPIIMFVLTLRFSFLSAHSCPLILQSRILRQVFLSMLCRFVQVTEKLSAS